MTKPNFPLSIYIQLPPYRDTFYRFFPEHPPPMEDFQEVMRQIIYEMLNHPYEDVLQFVGFTLPEPNRMRDASLLTPARANQLTLATAELTAMLSRFFHKADVFDINGTLSYTPRSFHRDLLLLDYVSG